MCHNRGHRVARRGFNGSSIRLEVEGDDSQRQGNPQDEDGDNPGPAARKQRRVAFSFQKQCGGVLRVSGGDVSYCRAPVGISYCYKTST